MNFCGMNLGSEFPKFEGSAQIMNKHSDRPRVGQFPTAIAFGQNCFQLFCAFMTDRTAQALVNWHRNPSGRQNLIQTSTSSGLNALAMMRLQQVARSICLRLKNYRSFIPKSSSSSSRFRKIWLSAGKTSNFAPASPGSE